MSYRATLMIVDDEAYVRDSLAAVLERRGFDTRTAASVDDALAPGALEGVDLVLSPIARGACASPTAAPSSSTKSIPCRCKTKPSCYGF